MRAEACSGARQPTTGFADNLACARRCGQRRLWPDRRRRGPRRDADDKLIAAHGAKAGSRPVFRAAKVASHEEQRCLARAAEFRAGPVFAVAHRTERDERPAAAKAGLGARWIRLAAGGANEVFGRRLYRRGGQRCANRGPAATVAEPRTGSQGSVTGNTGSNIQRGARGQWRATRCAEGSAVPVGGGAEGAVHGDGKGRAYVSINWRAVFINHSRLPLLQSRQFLQGAK